MPTPRVIPIKPLTSWSFSRYSDYKQCPLKFKLKHLQKIQEPPNDAMARGSDIHTKAEKYLKGQLRALPAELKSFKDEFKVIKALAKKKTLGAIVEDNWSFTKDWDQTTWNDWAGCWLRVKLDAAHFEELKDGTLIMVVTDWKTGKFRPDKNEEYVEQLELYALAAMLLYEHIDEVRPRLAYVDMGVVYPEPEVPFVFTRTDIPKLKKTWEKRVAPMFKDKKFAPRPNNLCRWCHYRASNKGVPGGGLCKY